MIINRLFAAMFLTVAVVSCSKESQPLSPAPEPVVEEIKPVAKVINYSVSVKNGSSSTKAIIDPDDPNQRRQVFATGDQLKISGTDITGTLNLQSGAGTQSAQFVGTLQYTGSGDEPAPSLALSAILTNANDKRINNGYSNAISSSLSEAVEQFSNLTATSTYGERTFNLTQGSTFINFDLIAYGLDGSCTVTITDDNSYSLSGTVTVSDEKAVFTASFAGGTTLVNPIVTITSGTKVIKRPFGSASTSLGTNKASKVTDKAPQIGDIYYSDGTWSRNRQTSGAQALGLIVYVNNSEARYPSGVTDAQAFKDGVTEKANGFGHGLVIAMSNHPIETKGVLWSTNTTRVGNGDPNTPFEQDWWSGGDLAKEGYMLISYNGIGKTRYMQQSPNVFPVAGAITDYNTVAPITTDLMSGWFLPTVTQWIATFMGLGECPNDDFVPSWRDSNQSGVSQYVYFPKDGDFYYQGNISQGNIYDKFSYYASEISDFTMPTNICAEPGWNYQKHKSKNYNWNYYWTSTQISEARALCVGFRDGVDGNYYKGVILAHQEKNRAGNGSPMTGRSVRAFLAF